MLAPAPTRLTPEATYLRTKCGLPPVHRARIVIGEDPDDPAGIELTTAQAAAAARVTEATIRDWARQSRTRAPLIHSVSGPGEAPRYLELEVLEAERATRRAARARRLAAEARQDSGSVAG